MKSKHAVLGGIFLLFLNGAIISSYAQTYWTWRNPLPSGCNLTSVVSTDSLLVAVGSNGVIHVSKDGDKWISSAPGQRSNLISAVFVGKQVIALSSSYYGDSIFTSKDGISWSIQPRKGQNVPKKSVAWTGSQWVAIGAVNEILTSPDGITWTSRSTGTPGTFLAITGNTSQIVAVGTGGALVTSPDGFNWTGRTSGTAEYLNSIIWADSQFVVVGSSGTVLSSRDGISWSSRVTGNGSPLNFIFWTDSQFVAIGPAGTMTSPDGMTWIVHPSDLTDITSFIWTKSKLIGVSKYGRVVQSIDGINWSSKCVTLSDFKDIVWTGSQFICVGNNGIIISSPNGIDWVSQISGSKRNLYSIALTDKQAVVVGDSGEILKSMDCIHWTKVASGTQKALWSIIWTGTIFVAVGDSGMVSTSDDGTTWWSRSVTDRSLWSVVWTGSLLCAVGGGFITSTDMGVSWKLKWDTSTPYEWWYGFRSVTYTGSQLVAVGRQGFIRTSYDGDTWYSYQIDNINNFSSVYWHRGQLIAPAGVSIWTSLDGAKWYQQIVYANLSWNATIGKIAFSDSLAVGIAGHGAILTTPITAYVSVQKTNHSKPVNQISLRITREDFLSLSGLTGNTNSTLSIYTPAGRKILEHRLKSNQRECIVPIHRLASGAYLLSVNNSEGSMRRFFIKY